MALVFTNALYFYTITDSEGKQSYQACPFGNIEIAAAYFDVPVDRIERGASTELPFYDFGECE